MSKNWAIVVGINKYDNLQPLKYAQRDAEAMQSWFINEANFDRVFLFTEDSSPIPTNPPIPTLPNQARFKRFLNAQFEEPLLKAEDNLWFFFAGHGKRFLDQDYLMFLDSDPTDHTTAISVDYVTQRLRRCGADNVVLLIDACRDEGDRSGLGVGMQEHQGVITFYSCAASQKSWEIDELQHGSFTYSLLEGLRMQGEANCATVERLEQHLRYGVPQINSFYKKTIQHPVLKAEPPYKMYYILLEKVARLKDVEPLKYQASLAENRGELTLAKQLWIRILATSRGDLDAINAIERIALHQHGNSEPASLSRNRSINFEFLPFLKTIPDWRKLLLLTVSIILGIGIFGINFLNKLDIISLSSSQQEAKNLKLITVKLLIEDAKTQVAIPGVKVSVESLASPPVIGYTDDNGYFDIKIPEKKYIQIYLSKVGFKVSNHLIDSSLQDRTLVYYMEKEASLR